MVNPTKKCVTCARWIGHCPIRSHVSHVASSEACWEYIPRKKYNEGIKVKHDGVNKL